MELGSVFRWGSRSNRPASGGTTTTSASTTRPDQRTVIAIAELWAHKGHAVITGCREGAGTIAYGEAVDEASLALIEAALTAGKSLDIRVVAEPPATGCVPGTADLLWEALLTCWTSAHEVIARLNYEIWEGPAWERVADLPLRPALRDLLDLRSSGTSLDDLLRKTRLDASMVAMDLSALNRLTVIEMRFNGKASSASIRVRAPRILSIEPSENNSVSTSPTRARLQQRRVLAPRDVEALQRELRILTKVDPWRALGLGRAASIEDTASAADRLRERYGLRPTDSPEVTEILEDFQARITDIARALGEQQRAEAKDGNEDVEPMLDKGRSIMQNRGPTAALGALRTAMLAHRDSGLHQAWYGWALFNARDKPLQERAFLALEHLRQAQALGGGPTELRQWLSKVELALCTPPGIEEEYAEMESEEFSLDGMEAPKLFVG